MKKILICHNLKWRSKVKDIDSFCIFQNLFSDNAVATIAKTDIFLFTFYFKTEYD